jgi:hypothetical protein
MCSKKRLENRIFENVAHKLGLYDIYTQGDKQVNKEDKEANKRDRKAYKQDKM